MLSLHWWSKAEWARLPDEQGPTPLVHENGFGDSGVVEDVGFVATLPG
jgi:hypothetical protein